ncbi:hypothetical protein A9995_13660 [Erythrobacter sp. QSSC1-22B]|uniref:TonB-dependent siderophore receptor n=1 Tax=Erythrobacter sp. QSSC1-22B TaxID=1860125 RepID=UPI000804C4B0|nr:TonB-dependent siderophore receptor [Erythrobacter sp. QSSC1-22B]OBX17986.1 hypothetical protein A9995_13660 [Erythrobacter sp. QSSC1-22B]
MRIRSLSSVFLGSAAAFACQAASAQTPSTQPDGQDAETTQVEDIVVTGRYSAATAVTGTKSDTPLIEIPQAVVVISNALLNERRPLTLMEALYNSSGVADVGSRRAFDNIVIRGFDATASIYLDGLRVERGSAFVQQEPFGLERIEVLKGPGSVLFGQGSLGGIVNQISKRPTSTPQLSAEIMGGSFGTYQGSVDIGGPLTSDGTISGRVNALYRDLGDSIDFVDKERAFLAPSLKWSGGNTTVTVLGSYTRDRREGAYAGLPPESVFLPNSNGTVDRSRYIGEPDFDGDEIDRYQIGYQLEHAFSDRWLLRQNARYSDTEIDSRGTFSAGLDPDLRTLQRFTAAFDQQEKSTAVDTHIQGRFQSGIVDSTLIVGADVLFQKIAQTFNFGSAAPLDLYTPVYGGPLSPLFGVLDFERDDTLYGFYIQNQLSIGDKLTVLLGGRYDVSETDNLNLLNAASRDQRDADFTFRAGAVYQVMPGVGLFASYAEAFNPNFGATAAGEPFVPETAVQYEAGIKTDLNNGRIRATASVYQLTRDNVLVPFPDFPGTQIQTGQQRSRGFEADLAFRATQDWNITAAYTYTDAQVRRDTNPLLIGDNPISVPEQQFNLWSTYDITLGRGTLTLGGGGRYVGKRQGTLPNSYELPDYAVVDAAAIYRLDRWRFQVNAYNLLDSDYVDSASPTGTRTVLLGEPLTVRASIGYAF